MINYIGKLVRLKNNIPDEDIEILEEECYYGTFDLDFLNYIKNKKSLLVVEEKIYKFYNDNDIDYIVLLFNNKLIEIQKGLFEIIRYNVSHVLVAQECLLNNL